MAQGSEPRLARMVRLTLRARADEVIE